MTRKAIRHEFTDLLTARLAGLVSKKPGTTEPAVYKGQVADFGKARAAVVVSSGGGYATPFTVRTLIGHYDIAIDIFVLYADADANWDEEMAEDLLDDISDEVMNTIADNPTGRNWHSIDWQDLSQTDPVQVGGVEYRHEKIILKPS
jgi:hypothetical protein